MSKRRPNETRGEGGIILMGLLFLSNNDSSKLLSKMRERERNRRKRSFSEKTHPHKHEKKIKKRMKNEDAFLHQWTTNDTSGYVLFRFVFFYSENEEREKEKRAGISWKKFARANNLFFVRASLSVCH